MILSLFAIGLLYIYAFKVFEALTFCKKRPILYILEVSEGIYPTAYPLNPAEDCQNSVYELLITSVSA